MRRLLWHTVPYLCVALAYVAISARLGRWNPYDWNKFRVGVIQINSFYQGWGEIGIRTTSEGDPITINGIHFVEAIGTHAHSRIEILTDAKGTKLSGICGYPDNYQVGEVVCRIFDEDREIFASTPLNKDNRVGPFLVTIPRSRQLILEVTSNKQSYRQAHAAWANFELQ
jgi:hypothetical protein